MRQRTSEPGEDELEEVEERLDVEDEQANDVVRGPVDPSEQNVSDVTPLHHESQAGTHR